ncbi:Transposase-like protein, IS1239 [Streptococcus pneumoniae AP200]|nr:Transposase-like protein, IS1239 [Streptococcus pneumoniae AP200]
MQEHYTPKGKHLTIDNRRLIERWKNENKSNREIAGLLGKAPQRFIMKSKEVQLYNK